MGQTLSEFDFSVVGRYALNIILLTLQLFFLKNINFLLGIVLGVQKVAKIEQKVPV